jgi:ATP-dependent metalloprotease
LVDFYRESFKDSLRLGQSLPLDAFNIKLPRRFERSFQKHFKSVELLASSTFSNAPWSINVTPKAEFPVETYTIDRQKVHELMQSFFMQHNGHNYIQNRGFKTYRSVESELKRNPGIVKRIKDALGAPNPQSPGLKVDPAGMANSSVTAQNESLTKLLQQAEDSTFSEDQRQRLKIAFAEGYLTANHPDNVHKQGRALKYLKV